MWIRCYKIAIVIGFFLSSNSVKATNDTITVEGFHSAMNYLYDSLEKDFLTTNLLINKSTADSSIFYLDGKLDSTIDYPKFLLNYNQFETCKENLIQLNPFLSIDSSARSKPYIPIGLMIYGYEFVDPAAIQSGSLSIQNGHFISNQSNLNPFKKSFYFAMCPLSLLTPENTTVRLDSNFFYGNLKPKNFTIYADLFDGIGPRKLDFGGDYNWSFNPGFKNIQFLLITDNDTFKVKCKLFVADSSLYGSQSKGYCDYLQPDVPIAPISADMDCGLVKEGNPTGRYAVWLGCGNDANGNIDNTLEQIRKPYIISGGFNPLKGKSLDKCRIHQPESVDLLQQIAVVTIASAIAGVISATSGGLIPPLLGDVMALIYSTDFYGGWRGTYYETYNGCFNKFFSPNEISNTDNGNQLLDKLREEGYDIIILQYDSPTDYLENNAAVMISLIKKINDQLRLNGSKHELIVGGYSAGAVTTRLALAQMEKNYSLHKGEADEIKFPHHRSRIFMSIEGEYQGANTPLGFQHLVDNLYKTIPNTPLDVLGIILAKITKDQLNNPTAKELCSWHYQSTISGNSAGPSPERLNLVATQNSLGFPNLTRNVGVSQGSSMGKKYQEINTNLNMFHIFNSMASGLYPLLNIGYFKEFTSNYTPTLDTNWTIFERKEGMSIRFMGQTVNFNLVPKSKRSIVIHNSKPYDLCPGSLLSADKTFNKSGAELIYGTLYDITNPSASNAYYHQGTNQSFAPSVSTLDIHNLADANSIADLFFDLSANGLTYASNQNGIPLNSPDFNYGYPHIAFPLNHYSLTPFDAICAVGNNFKADNHYHVEDPQALMSDFVLGEAAPQNLYLSNRIINEQLPFYNFWNSTNAIIVNTNKYQAAYEARNKIICGKDIYYINTQDTNALNHTFKELTAPGNFILGPNSDSEFNAGNEIDLYPGFEVKEGALFEAKVQPYFCPNDYQTQKMNLSFSNQGASEINVYNEGLSLSQEAASHKILIFPNPAENTLFFEFPSDLRNMKLSIYNSEGKMLIFLPDFSDRKLNLQNLCTGIYTVELKTDQWSESHKLIISKN